QGENFRGVIELNIEIRLDHLDHDHFRQKSGIMADDPRDSSLEVKTTRPPQWTETSDLLSPVSMVFAGSTMFTRNRQMGWPALAIALSAWVNQHPLRTKEGGQGIGAF
ncbi:hypothetical protein CPB86DRAFT_788439, partial [Serendipita vermifera]